MEYCGIIKFDLNVAADKSISDGLLQFRIENKSGTPGAVFICFCINGSINVDK